MMTDPDDDLLWRYLDGELAAREHALVEKALAERPEWRERLASMRHEDEVLRAGVLESSLDERARRIAEKIRGAIQAERSEERPPGSRDESLDRRGPGDEVQE